MCVAAGLALLCAAGLGVAWYASQQEGRPPTENAGIGPNKPLKPMVPPLDQKEREFLWEVEHRGNVLNRHGFSTFAAALAQADGVKLSRLLAADFRGGFLKEPRQVSTSRPYTQAVRLEDNGRPPEPLAGGGFVARLLEYRGRFAEPPKVKLALMALGPCSRQDLKGPWKGTGLLRLWGPAASGGPCEIFLNLKYEIDSPTEKRLAKNGWLHTCAVTQVQEARSPRVLMREVAAQRGIHTRRFHDNWTSDMTKILTGGVYLCDFDRDGILDMLVTDIRAFTLYKGLPGGKFQDVTAAVGLPTQAPTYDLSELTAAFVDLDGDGWEDLILGSRVYRNMGGKKFVDYTHRTNLRLPPDLLAIAPADFDRDGKMDLYVIGGRRPKDLPWYDDEETDRIKGKHQLWRNKGDWQFEDVTAQSGTSGGNRSSFSVIWLDADNDGWPDLYAISEFGRGLLLVNQHDGTFRPKYLTDGQGDFGTMGVTCGDIDNDGNIDLFMGNMYSKAGNRIFGNLRPGIVSKAMMDHYWNFVKGSQLYLNRGGLRFEPRGKEYQVNAIGWSYGAALVDLDNDGWLDLYATCGFLSLSRNELDG
jgi:hypothetical protein